MDCKDIFKFFCAAAFSAVVCGCAANKEILSVSDLSVAELEKRMNAAVDPQGLFAASKSYVMRQEIREKQWLDEDTVKMVELKFEKPDKLALITYDDNQISSVFCSDGSRGWIADYNSKKVMQLDAKGLRRMQTLTSLSRPGGGGYQSVFKRVDIHKCVNDDGIFYRLSCYGSEQEYPLYFYIDAKDYLLRRAKMKVVVGDGKVLDYENRIDGYAMRDGVVIPIECEVRQLGATQKSKVIHYELNAKFAPSEFQAPVF